MNTLDFVATLMPSVERARVIELISDSRAQVTDNLIPMYENAAETLGGKGVESHPGKALGAFMANTLHMRYASNPIAGISKVINGLPDRLEKLDELIRKTFKGDVARDAMNYREVSILQYLNALTFVVDYSGPLLDRIVAAEVAVQSKRPQDVDAQLKPAQRKYLDENLKRFGDALTIAAQPIAQVLNEISKIPEVTVVPENHEVAAATVGLHKLDPLKFNLIGLGTNPAYFIGKWWVDRQVAKYEATKEERKTVELRLLSLRNAYSGKQDASVEAQIKYNENRLADLSRKVAKMEERWA